MHNTLVLLVVGLTRRLLGEETPHLSRLAATGLRTLDTVLPAVTCTVQSTLPTGLAPADHGAVANGWYFRDQAEVWLWRQSNRLIAGEKVWEAGKRRDPAFTCANMFWWYNIVFERGFQRHAPADVPGGRPQDSGPLRRPRNCARSSMAGWATSRFSRFGVRQRTSARAGGSPRPPLYVRKDAPPNAHPVLSATSGLWATEMGT